MPQTTRLIITNEHVNLLSVSGRLDGIGLRTLQQQIDLLLDAGARFLLTDLSRAEHCDSQLFDLLARTSNLVQQRGGWLRLVAPGNSVVSVIDETALSAAFDETALSAALPMDPTLDHAYPAVGHA